MLGLSIMEEVYIMEGSYTLLYKKKGEKMNTEKIEEKKDKYVRITKTAWKILKVEAAKQEKSVKQLLNEIVIKVASQDKENDQ